MKRSLLILTVFCVMAMSVYLGTRRNTTVITVTPPPATVTNTPEKSAPAPTVSDEKPLFSRTFVPRPRAMLVTGTNAPADWEAKIEQALTAEGSESEMSARLLELYPGLPPEGQAELAPHLVAVLPDADYASVGTILTNIATPEAVLDVLLTDLMDRPAVTRLNTLLTVARNAAHPKAEDARDMLVALMEQDHAQDWKLWETKIAEWLVSHPE